MRVGGHLSGPPRPSCGRCRWRRRAGRGSLSLAGRVMGRRHAHRAGFTRSTADPSVPGPGPQDASVCCWGLPTTRRAHDHARTARKTTRTAHDHVPCPICPSLTVALNQTAAPLPITMGDLCQGGDERWRSTGTTPTRPTLLRLRRDRSRATTRCNRLAWLVGRQGPRRMSDRVDSVFAPRIS
jgi:hypothetical protein